MSSSDSDEEDDDIEEDDEENEEDELSKLEVDCEDDVDVAPRWIDIDDLDDLIDSLSDKFFISMSLGFLCDVGNLFLCFTKDLSLV